MSSGAAASIRSRSGGDGSREGGTGGRPSGGDSPGGPSPSGSPPPSGTSARDERSSSRGVGRPADASHNSADQVPRIDKIITTIGVKRPSYGKAGRSLKVWTNHFQMKIPGTNIYHYDEIISPTGKTLPIRLNMEIFKRLQFDVAPDVFTPRAVYDGRKNVFAARELPFPSGSQEVSNFFTLTDTTSSGETAEDGERRRGGKIYKVRLKLVATINPEVLSRFLQGTQSHDNAVPTAITALNVVIRMEPVMHYPFNVRSFFTNRETADIGAGMVLWRGYFQSVRPAIGRMLINVDISTAVMYMPGPIIDVALGFLKKRGPHALSLRRGLPDRELIRLQRHLSGVRINIEIPGQSSAARRPARPIKKLTRAGADELSFTMRDGQTVTVAQYFEMTHNYKLRWPDIVCIELASGAIIPMECCTLPEGQIMRKQVPPDMMKDVLKFATKRPPQRLQSIREAPDVLNYGQSEYLKHFGMEVSSNAAVESSARVLDPPTLKYGQGSRQPTITPRDGAWNMVDKKFYRPATIKRWVVVVYEREQQFNMGTARAMVRNLLDALVAAGMVVNDNDPVIFYDRPQRIYDTAGKRCIEKHGGGAGPNLMVIVLPESSADYYQAIKHFGDIQRGVATQCLKSYKCKGANKQYFSNVVLKINVKLGGINVIPDARSVPALTDPKNPTIVMGADIMHPAPGAHGRPSFTALVGNLDHETAKYVADCRVQTSRQEMIDDLESMATAHIAMYKKYRTGVEKKFPADPKRLIFYRDGVSEGEFKTVLDYELPQLKRALANNNVEAKITLLVVSKGHHVRFFPQKREDADRSENCPAGTVVDNDITHPTEFDFYLQSHAGLLGTSRPTHYNVLYDENGFTTDDLQSLTFALCHVYARSTRSVSVPAPVYYADIVCSRAKNHYSPEGDFDLTESGTHLELSDAGRQLEAYRANFKPLHDQSKKLMYFT
ncbi:Piwi-domain-containing protein [Dichomitus squalens LYAD-421 SS1]|uniref:Piwi-domain-containing protein n=1 Tax=Dichomitus squalens (strain LYAD-421) TaxID=732165 RepID=R7SXM5_DICSQ|nr:Piwi-domain-containing protein [Dichomitus squalens LYAD-421 SS1]EJF60851.1 Piwi-domain-containing protein [Dichomitus squalens LYAD-421 SS1]